jgi:hypothetical protein
MHGQAGPVVHCSGRVAFADKNAEGDMPGKRGVVLGAVGGAVVAFVVLLLGHGPFPAKAGRYQIVQGIAGVARLDTVTGEIRGCITLPRLLPFYSCDLSVEGAERAEALTAQLSASDAISAVVSPLPPLRLPPGFR